MSLDQIKRRYPAQTHRLVLISEVTRMTKGYYCVAGWDVHSNRMVRLLQANGENWLYDPVFIVGNLVSYKLSGKRNTAFPHATEDSILTAPPTLIEYFDESEMYSLLLGTTFESVAKIFGRALFDEKYIIDGTNCRSLGGLRIERSRIHFVEDSYRKLRLRLHDNDDVNYCLPVTDAGLLRMFSEDTEPHFGVAEANEWLDVNPPEAQIILRVGLARGWSGKEGTWSPRRCYAQLNGIICPDDNYCIFAG